MPLKGTGHRLVGAKIASSVDNMETFCSHPAFLTETSVNVDIFAQYIFSCILRMVSNARKYDVRKNINH